MARRDICLERGCFCSVWKVLANQRVLSVVLNPHWWLKG